MSEYVRDHHKLEEFMHKMAYHDSENSARSSQKESNHEPQTNRDYTVFEETGNSLTKCSDFNRN